LPLTTTAIRGSGGKKLALTGLEPRPTWLGRLDGSRLAGSVPLRLGGFESGFCITAGPHTKLEGKA
jgi:hypothetical protein